MKVEVCNFSGYKIYPGHGKRFVKADARSFTFLNGKCESSTLNKRNPRKTNWTVIYRRVNKKGTTEEISKKRTRRTKKFARGVVGAPLEVIKAKRNQKLEVRQAQRASAIAEAKAKNKAKNDAKKKEQKNTQPRTKAPISKGPKAAKSSKPKAQTSR